VQDVEVTHGDDPSKFNTVGCRQHDMLTVCHFVENVLQRDSQLSCEFDVDHSITSHLYYTRFSLL
jgi:hypothetical protein